MRKKNSRAGHANRRKGAKNCGNSREIKRNTIVTRAKSKRGNMASFNSFVANLGSRPCQASTPITKIQTRKAKGICTPTVMRPLPNCSFIESPLTITIQDGPPASDESSIQMVRIVEKRRRSTRKLVAKSPIASIRRKDRNRPLRQSVKKLTKSKQIRKRQPKKVLYTRHEEPIPGCGNNVFRPDVGPKIDFAAGNQAGVFQFTARRKPRPISIDGQNVACEHGRQIGIPFSARGIDMCVEYFTRRGHTEVKAFLPRFRQRVGHHGPNDSGILNKLEKQGHLIYTPSRSVNGRNFASYDDRYVVQYAAAEGGVIVSNDNYKDIVNESQQMKLAIETRLLNFNFAGNLLMFPDDPMGRHGPHLTDFLTFPA